METLQATLRSLIETDIKLSDEEINDSIIQGYVASHSDFHMAGDAAVFVSFDKKAVRLLNEQGVSASVPQ